jgi:hypothetical protein
VTDVALVRPTGRRAAVIALGVGAPVVFLALLLSLAVTDGSYWSFAGAALGYLVAWLRASRLSVTADADRLVVRNFYGSRSIARVAEQEAVPFSHWLNPNFTCLAATTASGRRQAMHATALPDRQKHYEAEARSFATRLGLTLHEV